ncbi:transcription-repair coupling factor (superfamily II helicase) [Thioalkalivibrio sp. ALE21]|uniref:transcription-repair coupling factor n=1 Tax=Thioalkalivibrio sp. ALE21 TaxID=1158175 RepID=UPI000D8D9E80|nr:transcription-repair coupling factor [Thioalkalivibrio sp. ALE21]PYG04046.1 transcription-repair coupling factor (superfamily II helicase) [Thioalkalivibrio sp. ALE21]
MSEELRNPLNPGRLPRSGFETWTGLGPSASTLALGQAVQDFPHPLLVITESNEAADQWEEEWSFFTAGRDIPLLRLPDWETLPFDVFSPHEDIISERLRTLYRLPGLERGIILMPVATLMQRLPPRQWLAEQGIALRKGQRLDRMQLREDLVQAGYNPVQQVIGHGEFAVRGEILDLFPMGAEQPVRIEFLDDEIDSLRHFDPESQRSTETTERLEILPSHEFPLHEEAIREFRSRYRTRFEGDPGSHPIYRDISEGLVPPGIESYLPLFFEALDTVFDYCPQARVVQVGDIATAAGQFADEVFQRYDQLRHQVDRPLLPPDELYLNPEALAGALGDTSGLALGANPAPLPAGRGREVRFQCEDHPDMALEPARDDPARRLQDVLSGGPRVLVTTESAGRREALLTLLRDHGLDHHAVAGWEDFLASEPGLHVTVGTLAAGFRLPDDRIVVPESALMGERARQTRRRARPTRDADAVIQNLSDLTIGAPVVHEEQGVGRYLGLQTMEINGQPSEFLTLEYADGARLYVPVSSLHLISRYAGADAEHAPLHRLGSEQWSKARRKAAEKARDVAAELLDIHARRAATQGTVFETETPEYHAFAAGFPFEETLDQQQAIDAVLSDMAADQPMDRVICGDVGFGKTEVAMRAAFVAVQNHKQVVVLVPTTLLAQQHHQNFIDRFADWPVQIESLSRFRSAKQQEAVLEGLREGKVDIVIGTHKLLQKDLKIENLGLVIVDEEQRFGVRHKEALKKLRAQVDMLTMTATPIPRTLNMALAGLRDLSVITTPPRERLAVKTFVNEWNDAVIQEACLREIRRGGQVYFVHNEVNTIDKTAAQVRELLPGARVGVAHGQMRESELEQVMLDFYHRRYNILVCSTIIETGIDVPTANTIVMNRADKLGLAQMHQLRGRVGRSHHRAYAYLLTPPWKSLTADAKKRLEAIASLEDLGVGFTLASHDLEIRGAGELLGDEQSGQITEVGFNMYNDLLNRAVNALRSGKMPELEAPEPAGTEVELGMPALLPDEYVPDVHTRLILYKRISNADSEEALRDLEVELVDRFGLLPDAARTLFAAAQLRLRLTPLGIRKLEMGPAGGRLVFGTDPDLDIGALVELVQSDPQGYRLDGQKAFHFHGSMETLEARTEAVHRLLNTISRNQEAA